MEDIETIELFIDDSEDSGIDASWDGTYNDVKQPLETYAVLVDVEFCDQTQKSYRDNITLIR